MTESNAIAYPGLVAATSRPPNAVAEMTVVFMPKRSSAFACWRIASGTVCGTMPAEAGKKNADETPLAAASTASCQISARPERSSTASAAWLAPESTFEATITWCRGSRSDQTPPTSRKIT